MDERAAVNRRVGAGVLTPAERLREAADLFEKRNATYGGNYKDFGPVMTALFPHGVHTYNETQATRLCLIVHMVTKLTRYTKNFYSDGGHPDSLADLSVYAMMAAEVDDAVVLAPQPNGLDDDESIPMVLHCPKCHVQHIDEPTMTWTNPPHRSHMCSECGTVWRPADVPTRGIMDTATQGKSDTWPHKSFTPRASAGYVGATAPQPFVQRPDLEKDGDGQNQVLV